MSLLVYTSDRINFHFKKYILIHIGFFEGDINYNAKVELTKINSDIFIFLENYEHSLNKNEFD